MNITNVLEYSLPEISRREVLRYMSCGSANDETEALIDRCVKESENVFSCRIAYRELSLSSENGIISVGTLKIKSLDLQKALDNCQKVIIFAATVGIGIDRLILKYSHTSPASALCMQAIGAERIESLCDKFCLDMKEKYADQGMNTHPRFSPGYGDLAISLQRDIFNLLECEKRIGLTLNDSLLMSPTKSVTAIIGIKENIRH